MASVLSITITDGFIKDSLSDGAGVPRKSESLNINTGQCGQIIGPVACGKTDLLSRVALQKKSFDNNILLFGQDISDLNKQDKENIRLRLTYVNQDCRPLPHLSVLDNLALPLRLQEIAEKKVAQHCEQLLVWLKLTSVAKMPIYELSRGQSRMLVISQAIIGQPELLIIDDLLIELDDYDRERISFLLEKLRQKGMAILLSSHKKIKEIAGTTLMLTAPSNSL